MLWSCWAVLFLEPKLESILSLPTIALITVSPSLHTMMSKLTRNCLWLHQHLLFTTIPWNQKYLRVSTVNVQIRWPCPGLDKPSPDGEWCLLHLTSSRWALQGLLSFSRFHQAFSKYHRSIISSTMPIPVVSTSTYLSMVIFMLFNVLTSISLK